MMTALLFVAAGVVGYTIGSLNPATAVARFRGTDLRAFGTGNPGATNAARAMGVRVGIVVGTLDMLKGFVPAIAFAWVDLDAGLIAGVAAVLGHVSSPYLRGRGGKGVATSLGAVLGIQPLWGLIALVAFVVVAVSSRWMALASLAAAVTLPAVALAVGASRPELAWAVVLAAIVVFRHRVNIVMAWRRRHEPIRWRRPRPPDPST